MFGLQEQVQRALGERLQKGEDRFADFVRADQLGEGRDPHQGQIGTQREQVGYRLEDWIQKQR
jgi:hypothetical protein